MPKLAEEIDVDREFAIDEFDSGDSADETADKTAAVASHNDRLKEHMAQGVGNTIYIYILYILYILYRIVSQS